MKYIVGSFIISFGILFVTIVVLNAMNIKAPDDIGTYLAIAWVVVAIVSYPLAKKVIRD